MTSVKTLVCIALVLLAVSINIAEGAPLLWDFLYGKSHHNQGHRTGRNQNRGPSSNNEGSEYGNLCRLMNPSNGWSNTGTFEYPNCPP